MWGGTQDELAAGERSSDLHRQDGEEEVLVVLDGHGSARSRDATVVGSVSVRETLGAEHIGCTLDEIADGKQLWPYRSNEEWLLVRGRDADAPRARWDARASRGRLRHVSRGRGRRTFRDRPGRVAIFSTRTRAT